MGKMGVPKGNIPWNKGKKGVMPLPWNKGLTKEDDPMVARIGNRTRLGNRNPRVVWNKGLKYSEDMKACLNLSGLEKGWGWNKGKECFKKERNPFYGKRHTKETRLRISSVKTRQMKDPSLLRRCLSCRKPNKSELKLLSILQKVNPSWRYVGDGKLIISGKCPDFSDNNGKLIELFGRHWHEPEEERERADFFKERGYVTLVIWEHELKDEMAVTTKVVNFAGVMRCRR